MKITMQEIVKFSKGRCCFVRFECAGTSDRALLREDDATELLKRWDAFADMYAALLRAERKLSAYVGVCKGDKELTDTVLPMCQESLKKAEGRQ